MAIKMINESSLRSVADAIRAKSGTSEPLEYPDGFVSAIEDIPTGEGGGSAAIPEKEVNFYDYDGTCVYSYTPSEFAALTEMPANPSHEGLTAQGWNWSLSDAKTYVADYGRLDVGQMYITDDGKTRIYIHLSEGRTSPMLGVCPNGTVDVDWGDGTAHSTLTGTSVTTAEWTSRHNYTAPGDYVIKLTVTGSMGLYGSKSSNQYSGLLRYDSGGDARNYIYRNAIRGVEIGNDVASIGVYAFAYCYSLTSVTIPRSVTSIDTNAFAYCYSLTSVTIPRSVTSISNNVFYNCYSLTSVTIPSSVTSIGDYALRYCYSLASVAMPSRVTRIGINAFQNCYGLAALHFQSTTPPTVSDSNAFSNLPADCKIYVPTGSLSVYTSATNYPPSAIYTYIEE